MSKVKKLVISALCLALCLVLPFLTGQIPQIGQMLSPMHIPAFLCGFLAGAPYGAVVGFIAPLLRFAMFQMPPMPTALTMAFELAAYGFLAGFLYRRLPKSLPMLYVALILAMLGGRIIWGIASYVILGVSGGSFTVSLFLAGGFINAIPAIILHIVIVPPLVRLVQKALNMAD